MVGGVANAGSVVRRGDFILRPANPHSASIHRFLRALHATGFEGASVPVAIEEGRERLRFIPGEVALVPYPDWAQSDLTLGSIARLLRRFHDAARSFDATGGDWASELADPVGGTTVCHNDVCLENVVFRQGRAVALVDFDYAAPGRPHYDLAHFARLCVPLDDDDSAHLIGWHQPDRLGRLRLVAEAYGLATDERDAWLAMIDQSIEQSGRFLWAKVTDGDPNFTLMWNWIGGWERFDRRQAWWQEHREAFAAALG